MWWIKHKIHYIKRMWGYMKVIHKTYDWDFGFCLQILIYSMERLAIALETGYHVHGDKQAKQVRQTIAALKRITQDREYWEQTGLDKVDFQTDFDNSVKEPETGLSFFKMKPLSPEHKKIFDNHPKKADYLFKQDWDYICKQFKNKSRGWWD